MRARSHEGKFKFIWPTQIHAATSCWTRCYASRQAGGIGSRGPGESQLEQPSFDSQSNFRY